jgi:hypothetical protein
MPVHLGPLAGPPTEAVKDLALADSIHDAFAIAAVICVVGIVASLVRGSAAHHESQVATEDRRAPA